MQHLIHLKKLKQKIISPKQSFPLVIKADGLAFGKGVVICQDYSEAIVHLKEFLKIIFLNQSGANIVIEGNLWRAKRLRYLF